jgi:hypothetical protein
MNDVVWAAGSLFGDTNWLNLQLSSCSVTTRITLFDVLNISANFA